MNDIRQPAQEPATESNSCIGVRLVLKPHLTDLGGFKVRRALPSSKQRKVGPWIFFDHAGPAEFRAGDGVDVRPHPHINLATVTYMFAGEFLHRDSIGSVQVIKPGDINLMVAGRGIVHSERTPPELRKAAHELHALQLWLALPEAQEEIMPAFYHYGAEELPTTEIAGVGVRVMMGAAFGLTSPVKTFAQTLYIEAHLQKGQRLLLPMAEERTIYLAEGAVSVNDHIIDQFTMAVLDEAPGLHAEAIADCRLVLIGGERLSERFIEWNFVSSSTERIAQAKQDWKDGRFASIPDDDQEFIPLP